MGLEAKINGILIGIITSIVVIISVFVLYDSTNEYYDNAERLSLQSAKTISFLPSLVNNQGLSEEAVQSIANQYIFENDIDFVIIKDSDGIIVTHPDPEFIGEYEAYDEHDAKTKLFGAYLTYETGRYQEPAIVSTAPIYQGDEFRVLEGVVKAGYFKSSITSNILDKLSTLIIIVVVFLLLSMLVSRLFTRYIKSQTLGYEPREITTILKNREKIFSSLDEGIIAADHSGNITYANESGKSFLPSNHDGANNIFHALPPEVGEMLKEEESIAERYFGVTIDGREIVILMKYLYEKEEAVGRIFILRDISAIAKLTNKLTVVESLFDDLRAQSHEYKNKLHLISGLLEMDKYQQIREVLNDEIDNFDSYNSSLVNIKEEHIKALLIAKMNKSSEKRIPFNINEESQLDKAAVSEGMINPLITIISNLIDNAIEAVAGIEHPEVHFYIGNFEGWMEIIVEDNGSGFDDEGKLFEKGFSTKGTKEERGYGLYNVNNNINALNGYLDFSHTDGVTRFIAEIPYQKEGNE